MTEIAVVILNWNTRNQLETFLPNIITYSESENTEVIVADNGSSDDSVDFLKKHYPRLRLIEFDQNHGFTGGYNKALSQIEARYYVLLNSDVEVTPGWLEPMKKCLDEDDRVAACMPRMRAYHDKTSFEYAGAAGGFIDRFGYPFCRGRILDTLEKDQGQYDQASEVFWATGACMFVRAELFHKLEGFDDDFFAHMEEIDLCWRMKNRGYSIRYVPESKVYHVGGGTLPNDNPFKLYLNYRNNLYLLYKNLPGKKLFPVLFMRLGLDILSSFIFLARGKTAGFLAVFKAHRHFFQSRPKLKSKRKAARQYNKEYPEGVFKGSILVSYFLKRRKTFARLPFQPRR